MKLLGRKPYKVYADEDGYRFSCRVKDCIEMSTRYALRTVAEQEAKDHFNRKHGEHDKEYENWISGLCGDRS